jgi:hypothetical protein
VGETQPVVLDLASLSKGIPALTSVLGSALAEAASECLAAAGHKQTCTLRVRWRSGVHRCALARLPVTALEKRAYQDLPEATELGACGIAILVVRGQTGLVAVERSVKGTGFDYWLGTDEPNLDDSEPFEHKARLEVSGILQGNRRVVEARLREKVRQARKTAGQYPAYIVVVEFGQPLAWMVRDD